MHTWWSSKSSWERNIMKKLCLGFYLFFKVFPEREQVREKVCWAWTLPMQTLGCPRFYPKNMPRRVSWTESLMSWWKKAHLVSPSSLPRRTFSLFIGGSFNTEKGSPCPAVTQEQPRLQPTAEPIGHWNPHCSRTSSKNVGSHFSGDSDFATLRKSQVLVSCYQNSDPRWGYNLEFDDPISTLFSTKLYRF